MPLVRHFFVFFCLTGILAWFPMAYYFAIVASAFGKAKRAGELPDISLGWRGVPVQVLFTDRLPDVRIQRLRCIFWFSIFLGCLVAAFLVGTVFGPNW